MNQKLRGEIIYLPLNQATKFDLKNLGSYEHDVQEIKECIISNFDDKGTKKIIFDVVGTADLWDGYVKGFLYNDGKFRGHFHHLVDSQLPSEIINGDYIQSSQSCQIRGTFYPPADTAYDFYLQIEDVKENSNEIQSDDELFAIKKERPHKIKTKKPETVNTISEVLNLDLADMLVSKSQKRKTQRLHGKYDIYTHIVKFKPLPNSIDNLILAMCVAYSWMPTMLDVYVSEKKDLNKLLLNINKLGTIKSLNDFTKLAKKKDEYLSNLTVAINHSIVGTSKVLHIFFPENIPILDSNVLKGWNRIFKKYYYKHPELKLPLNIPTTANRQINVYLKYWKLLLMLKHNTKIKSIRELEEPFYWIGMK